MKKILFILTLIFGAIIGNAQNIDSLRIEAEKGDADAQNELGKCYYFGDGVTQSYEEAVKWYRKAAEQGNSKAQLNFGGCYFSGEGVSKSYEEAVKWWS